MDERYIESIINNGSIHSFPLTFGRTFSYSSDINNKAVLLAQQHKIIKEIAARNKDFVIVGRSSNEILKEYKPFNIFVYANMKEKSSAAVNVTTIPQTFPTANLKNKFGA